MTLGTAKYLTTIMTGKVDTTRHNAGNPYREGNMLPIKETGTHTGLKTTQGEIPAELNGMFVRNGTNAKFEPTGTIHATV